MPARRMEASMTQGMGRNADCPRNKAHSLTPLHDLYTVHIHKENLSYNATAPIMKIDTCNRGLAQNKKEGAVSDNPL
jgi:hypothetical protein